jgi:peptidoglycan/xylan/chitin deacetylase (PgdA/CDA1 family)
MNTEFSTLLNNEQIPEGIKEDVKRESNTFRNEYEKYIYDQTALAEELPTANQGTTLNTEITSLDFLIPLEPQSINEAYYKLKVLKFLNKENTYLTSILDTLLEYSSDIQNSNTRIKLSNLLNPIIFNNLNNKTGIVYWNMFVFKDKTYVYPMYIAQEFTVNDANFNEPYDVEPLVQSKKSVRVPILMYHHIDPMPSSGSKNTLGLYVTPEVFEEQLAYLVKKNYKSITPQELYNLLKSGKNPSQKSVMITFDDSTKGQYINAYPLLKKYGFTAVYFVPSKKSSITYAQLREMGKNGMIIGSHSATHIDLVKEDDEQKLYSEIVESRYSLQSGTGQDVIFISYPGCVADSQVYPYVIQAGYLLGGSCGKSIDHYFRNRLSLSRVHVFNSLDNLKDILSGKP